MSTATSPRLLRFEPVNEGKIGPGSPDPYAGLDPSLRPDDDAHDGPITAAEKAEWIRCRDIVHRGLRTWRETGEALYTINRKRLYRGDRKDGKYDTFEECLLYEFGISRAEGYRLMGMFQAVENVQEVVPTAKAKEGRSKAAPSPAPTPPASTSVHSATPAQAPLHRTEMWISREAAKQLNAYSPDLQKRIAKRLEAAGNMEPTALDVSNAASVELLEDVKQARLSGKGMTLSVKDQTVVVKDADAKHVSASRKRATKDRIEKDAAKLIRWVEKLSKHVAKMERSGDFPMLDGMTEKALAFENEVKVLMNATGKKAKKKGGKKAKKR